MSSTATLGLNGSLYLAYNALSAQRAAIEVTGHNIANVNTPGYTRQRVVLSSERPITTGVGQQGWGVNASGIEQLRNTMIDGRMPGNISTSSYLDQKSSLLAQLQSSLGQPLDRTDPLTGTTVSGLNDGLADDLDKFYNSWQALSSDPTSTTLRQQVITAAQDVARKLNSLGSALTDIQTSAESQIAPQITDVNNDLASIAALNLEISGIEANPQNHANDLRDQRQQLIEGIATKLNINVYEEANHSVTIRLGAANGALLVENGFSGNAAGSNTVKLALASTSPSLSIQSWTGGELEVPGNLDVTTVQPSGGSIAALIEFCNTTIGGFGGGLVKTYDDIAAAFAAQVNAQHAAGFTLEASAPLYNTPGSNTFFTGITASTIAASFTSTDTLRLAASDTIGSSLDGDNARALSNLRTQTIGALGNVSIKDFYLNSIGNLGGTIRATNTQASTQRLVNQQLTEQRDSTAGVSLDEETANLVRFQHAYEAAARVLQTVDEMMKVLLAIGR